MKVSFQALSRHLDLAGVTAERVAEVLPMLGLEVESVTTFGLAPLPLVVVGEIKSFDKHPKADRLSVCQVDVGDGAIRQIVCGAPNARAGIKVPCALVGAELPPGEDGKPFAIKAAKLRGVDSAGMLCSARELKLSEDHGGLLELAADATVGQNIREHLRLDDTLFTLKLTPNLAHCLSVYGIAREVSALTDTPLLQPEFPKVPVQVTDRLPVSVQAPDLCGRFSGRIVRGVNTQAQTPAWMVERLARLREPELPEVAIRYTRKVTLAWSVFFFCNGLCAALLTLWAPLSWWMLYTGLISYGLMGLLFAIEWLIRQRVRGRP